MNLAIISFSVAAKTRPRGLSQNCLVGFTGSFHYHDIIITDHYRYFSILMSHVQTPKEALSPNGYPTDVTGAGHVNPALGEKEL